MLNTSVILVLNRLLADQPAARSMLMRHNGKAFRISLIAPIFAARIEADGNITLAPDSAEIATDIRLTPALLLRLIAGERQALSETQAEGDGLLAADIRNAFAAIDLALALRPYLGDILAARVVDGISAFHEWQSKAQTSAAQSVSEYLVHETDALASKAGVAGFVREVDALRDDVSRLEARLALLEQATITKNSPPPPSPPAGGEPAPSPIHGGGREGETTKAS